MNLLLEKKLNKLKKDAIDQNFWYVGKQQSSFTSLCYQIDIMSQFDKEVHGDPDEFLEKQVAILKTSKPDVDVTTVRRAMWGAKYVGLLDTSDNITPTFIEIKQRCNGEFERTELYEDIIERQIEKVFISSELDKKREDFTLYPTMLVYKVLLELGRATGNYSMSKDNYYYLLTTATKFEDFLTILLEIQLMEQDDSAQTEFKNTIKRTLDSRFKNILKYIPSVSMADDSISLVEDHVDEVAKKVFIFEKNPGIFKASNYLEFLRSTKSILDLSDDTEEKNTDELDTLMFIDETERIHTGKNILLYGVPGAGKSYTIEHDYLDENTVKERVVFHPDYTYADFVGQILPAVSEDSAGNKNVSYEFTAGPFTSILKEAYEHPNVPYVLIIEEINRGNAPAIFGEIFQLLDRKRENELYDETDIGGSEYGINNTDVATYVYGNMNRSVKIPSNLSIIGTMNTSDPNAFTLDTAFQRRWNMRLIENIFKDKDNSFANKTILDTSVTWRRFCETINEIILDSNTMMTSAEDKRLGTHFVSLSDFAPKELNEETKRFFPEKVIKYLWDDAFKFNREELFSADYNSLEKVIRKFIDSEADLRMDVFAPNVQKQLVVKTLVEAPQS